MRNILRNFVAFVLLGALYGCVVNQTSPRSETGSKKLYTDPVLSGLSPGNPYPTSNDVCVDLKSNSATEQFEMEKHFLIACPKHELGAINDRETQQNAKIVGIKKDWVVLSVPLT